MSQMQTQQRNKSQIRSHIELLIQTYIIVVFKMMKKSSLTDDFDTI